MKYKVLIMVLTIVLLCFPFYSKASNSNEIILSTDKQTLDLDGNNYKSDYISVINKDYLDNYQVKVINGGSNYVIVDKDGKERNTFNIDESFLVLSKKENVTKEEDIVLRIESINDNKVYGNIKLHVNWNKTNREISIKTIDSETNKMINGASYLIYDLDNNLIDEVVTNNYYAKTNLSYGKYQVIEKEAPSSYKKSNLEKRIVIDNSSPRIIDIEFPNDPLKSVSIATISMEDNMIISGAKMIVRDSESNIVKEFTSSSNRNVIDNLYYGTYTITETKAPSGYKLLEEPVTFTIDANSKDVTMVNISHNPYNGVKIYKLDKEDNGMKIEIINSEGEIVKKISSINNFITIDDLENGIYSLRDEDNPMGDINGETFEVNDNKLTTVYIVKSETNASPSSINIYVIVSIILGVIGYFAIYIAKKRYN